MLLCCRLFETLGRAVMLSFIPACVPSCFSSGEHLTLNPAINLTLHKGAEIELQSNFTNSWIKIFFKLFNKPQAAYKTNIMRKLVKVQKKDCLNKG